MSDGSDEDLESGTWQDMLDVVNESDHVKYWPKALKGNPGERIEMVFESKFFHKLMILNGFINFRTRKVCTTERI